MNIVAVRTMMETVSPQLGVEYAKNFGITTLTDTDMNAATALGGITKGVTNLELTSAFASIANGGLYTKPVFFTKILDHDGKLLIDNEPETKRVLKDSTAFLLTDAMKDSMQANRIFASSGVSVSSTSTRAALPNMSAAGKSGTTSNNNDIWFIGYTPYYTAGIWGGCDENQKLTVPRTAAPLTTKDIWRKIMTRVRRLSDPGFTVPDSVETAEICRNPQARDSGVCSHDPRGDAVYTEYFAKGNRSDRNVQHPCACHRLQASPDFFRVPTARRPPARIALPADEEGETDDSKYAMPTRHCSGHTSVTVDPSYLGPG